jgi:hypothetical protein
LFAQQLTLEKEEASEKFVLAFKENGSLKKEIEEAKKASRKSSSIQTLVRYRGGGGWVGGRQQV